MENLRWILDGLPMGVWVARAPDGAVEYVNRAFQAIMGTDAVKESRIDDAPAICIDRITKSTAGPGWPEVDNGA